MSHYSNEQSQHKFRSPRPFSPASGAMRWVCVAGLLVGLAGSSPQDQGGGVKLRHEPKYERVFQPGMNCNFELPGACSWSLVPANTTKTDGSDGLTRMKAKLLKRYLAKSDHKHRFQDFTDASRDKNGHVLAFMAAYTKSRNDLNHSYIESPWIEESLKYCTLSFDFLSTVKNFKVGDNEIAYMETYLVDDSHGSVALSPKTIKGHHDNNSTWVKLEYEIGSYNQFRIEIAFFRGVEEGEGSYFVIDNIQLNNCLKLPQDKPPPCNPETEYKCKRTDVCVSRSLDLCDYRRDCAYGDDEDSDTCSRVDEMNSGYRCDFSVDTCGWTASGPMRWERVKDDAGKHYLNLDISKYKNENLVTLGILRSPEFTPPPPYNDRTNEPAFFQSCALRLFFKATKIEKVDFFEVEIIEKRPFTKVSRGSTVKKPVSKRMKTYTQNYADVWTKIEAVIPKGMKYKYFIQLNAVKAPDTSGPADYNMSVANISLSPQCFGLGLNMTGLDLGCWRHDLAKNPKELADCMEVPYPEDTSTGVFSYAFTTCAENVGPLGPWQEECSSYYEYQGGNSTFVEMLSYDDTMVQNKTSYHGGELGINLFNPPIGIQKWTVPEAGVFTVIAKGASGGHGRLSRKSSHGAVVTAILRLNKGDRLYVVVGQEGQSACVIQGVESRDGLCAMQGLDPYQTDSWISKASEAVLASFHAGPRTRRGSDHEAGERRGRVSDRGVRRTGERAEKRRRVNQLIREQQMIMLSDEPRENFGSDMEGVEIKLKPPDSATCGSSSCKNWIEEINTYHPSYQSGGGGGGGATIIFKVVNDDRSELSLLVPIIVAGGGGGISDLSGNNEADSSLLFDPLGHDIADIIPEFVERGIFPNRSSEEARGGHGGGWNETLSIDRLSHYRDKGISSAAGGSQPEAWWGGKPCNFRHSNANYGDVDDVYTARWGGFGGGGGGCKGGGGGGGYIGGRGGLNGSENGEGGWSYIDRDAVVWFDYKVGKHSGPGEVFIIPDMGDTKNQTQCKCHDRESLCMALNEGVSAVRCYCRSGNTVDVNVPCTHDIPVIYLIILVIGCIVLAAIVGLLCMCLYTQYQRKRMGLLRNKLRGPDGQLNRLRNSNGIMMTEYNPNYEFGGGSCSLMDLREVDRDNLRLVKALGQGAFGEVYQGYFKKSSTDSMEMPVAVKTLPELSTNQAEMDFLMEALIMSKFNHSNIVHFIGVCFDKHPRFIILELLAGGDLKTFLRESRPKPDRPSTLTMRDLLNAAIDVAKGCSYLEENHFIHRDIAARNCLLTSKGPGRVVKIADFGMARDIYRADYYRKGGKAMLPVKWMPPEAFLDGIFTSKTDIWSFGILLWEVMSLGYMPYPGRGNQEVMQLVTNGGRLEPPNYCPGPLYGLMCQCWHPIPEERPNFLTILERLGYCLQDPEVVMAPLPVFHRPQSVGSQDNSISSRRELGEGNSSGNSGSGGSVSIGPPARLVSNGSGKPAADYLVPLSASQELLASPPDSGSGGPPAQRETSFTLLSSATTNSASRSGRGNYASLPTAEPPSLASSRVSPPTAANSRSRWTSSSVASSRSDLVSESKSTEPLLPASPTSTTSAAAVLDLDDGIPPPPRPYQGPAPPPLPPPPPHPYSDRMLPLNAAQLRAGQLPPPPPPSSYANIGMQASSAGGGSNQPRDVMIHAAGRKGNFSTSEISV